ncbi:unnamed protein product [Microthlaspi erraticum]|uniref:Uncharacterized protein n=1 Tax=Microthlaspi erraticum TaxID=1685480 RepID=A0A6D2HZR6_9BRAS|nr:unnamed protein product [Microthlaspi erraticum]
MDFIKTSSLRALSELTFQRNWIGIIWMSRNEVMIKISEDWSRRLIEQRPTAHRPNELLPRSSRDIRVPSRQCTAELTYRPGKHVPRSPSKSRHHKPRTTAPRTGSTLARRTPQPCRADPPSDQEGIVPRPAKPSAKPSIRRPDAERRTSATIDPTYRWPTRPIAGRPSERSGRPEARFEARFTCFQPGLT